MTAWLRKLAHLPREARDTLFLLAVIAWVVMPQVGELPLWCSLLTAGVLLGRGWLTVRSRPLPSPWWRRVLLAAVLVGTYASHGTLLGAEAGTTLIVALLALKTLELRARRDALVVFFLGFFVLLTNFFHSQSLLVALAMLVGLCGLLTALVNAHRPVGRPSLRESAGMALRMMLLGAPLMVALFMFFPRFAPLWGLPSDALSKSGLSSNIEVGNIAQLAQDESIALRVKFDGVTPAQSDLYFRGPVLNYFDGRHWSANRQAGAMDATGAPGPADLQVGGNAFAYELTLEPNRLPWLLTLDVSPEPPELPPGHYARMTADMQWVSARPVTDLLRYRARSHTQFTYGLQNPYTPPGRPRDMSPYLRLPTGFDPRTRELAEQLRSQAGGDTQAILRAAWQRLSNGSYRYTLEPGVYGQHTADEFWFDKQAGFCEHIASAFVVLMRAAGVPARMVAGFQGGELNPVDGYWIVRNSDAHAWAEVWLADRGWVRMDPTAAVSADRIEQLQRLRVPDGLVASALGNLSPGLLAQLRNLWDAVDNRWNQWVLNYTQTRQLDLLKHLGFESPSWQDLVKLLGALALIAALGGMAWAWWDRRHQDPWLRLLQRARQRLQRAGLPVPGQATPRELMHITQTSPALPPALRQRLHAWLLALERHRYAPAPGEGPAQGHDARQRLATLARQWRSLQSEPWPKPASPSAPPSAPR